MRLWHYKLIPYLPKGQLISQWRELNSIFKKQDNHILINYIYNHDKHTLYYYTVKVLCEMNKRGFKVKKWDNYDSYFEDYFKEEDIRRSNEYFNEHDFEYLQICYYNLKEKYIRGQKDFSKEQYDKLVDFMKGEGLL